MTFTMNKPFHKVLEDYDLLKVSVIQNTNTINMSAAMLWKMNLCAVSDEIPCTFFVAMSYRVNVYTLDTIYSRFKDPVKTLVSPEARQTGGGSESPFIINYIKVGKLLEKEVLVTCSENGEICIYRTENLDEPPMILHNDSATWGIAIHADQGLLAVSANNWRITVYNVLEMTKSNPIYGKRSNRRTINVLGLETSIELFGHEHNIPYIDFNETGRYLASASIDQTCRVWDLKTRQVVSQRNHARQNPTMEQDSWCWSVKFIKPGNFKFALCVDKNISKAYLQRLYQGRSTSLVNLGLCHSATTPVFPMSVSNVYNLGDEELDFSIYEVDEGSEMDDNAWDDALLREEDDAMEDIYGRQRPADTYIYNHGEIRNEIQQGQQTDRTDGRSTEDEEGEDDGADGSETDDDEEEEEIGPVILYRTEGEVDNEIQSEYNFNLSRREGLLESRQELPQSHESEELIQQRESGTLEDQSEEYEDAESDNVRENIEVWTTPPAPLPAPEDWTRIIENTEEQNRDGWGDEITPAPQPIILAQDSANAHSVNIQTESVHAILRDRLQAQVMNMQDVASFMNNGNGWDSNNDNNEDNTVEEDEVKSTSSSNSDSIGSSSSSKSDGLDHIQQNRRPRPYCIPNIIRSTSSSSIFAEKHYIEKEKKLHHHTVGEYLMISTGKDVMLMSPSTPTMSRIRAEHGLISKVDVRSDQILSVLDRINMVEWLPELELYVAASQKGTVALIRITQVEFEGGEQACIFNNECYLPTSVLQSTPLYGMTVQKVVGERFTPISYQIFLFYYSGNVLGYSLSRKDSDLLVENLIF